MSGEENIQNYRGYFRIYIWTHYPRIQYEVERPVIPSVNSSGSSFEEVSSKRVMPGPMLQQDTIAISKKLEKKQLVIFFTTFKLGPTS